MWATQIIPSALRGATAGRRARTTVRRAVFVLGAIGMMASAAVATAGSALANVGSQPGNLKFSPSSGAISLAPTWSTTDGCPAGYQGSAEVSVFDAVGTLLSRISNVAYNVSGSFSGKLDGSMSAILQYANVHKGGSLEFTIGCYSAEAGTGKVTWVQSSLVTLSSDGKSYTTSSPSGQQWSTRGSTTGQGGSSSSNGQGVAATDTGNSSGMGAGTEAGLIAGPIVVLAGIAGFIVYRRRADRSRLM